MNKILSGVLISIGFLIAGCSIVLIFFELVVLNNDGVRWGNIVFYFLTFTLGLLLALFKIRSIIKKKNRRKKTYELITQQKGKITAFELANTLNIPIKKASKILEKMCNSGTGKIEITDQGNLVYCFNGVISDEEKNSAKAL